MATRKTGSGTATVTANAVAELFLSLATNDAAGAVAAEAIINQQHRIGRCGVPAARLSAGLQRLICRWIQTTGPIASGQTGGKLADVVLNLSSGGQVLVEVKAQTRKGKFAEITQADWVRDETDFLRLQCAQLPFFAQAKSPPAVTALANQFVPSNLTAADLWLADLGLLSNAVKRSDARVNSAADLDKFLKTKWLLHVVNGWVRLICIADIPLVSMVRQPSVFSCRVVPNPQPLSSPRRGLGKIVVEHAGHPMFTYHLYENALGALMGRHKVHARLLAPAPALDEKF